MLKQVAVYSNICALKGYVVKHLIYIPKISESNDHQLFLGALTSYRSLSIIIDQEPRSYLLLEDNTTQ
jgi:hypothetical protein